MNRQRQPMSTDSHEVMTHIREPNRVRICKYCIIYIKRNTTRKSMFRSLVSPVGCECLSIYEYGDDQLSNDYTFVSKAHVSVMPLWYFPQS